MPELPSREVIHEHEFEEQLGRLIPHWEEADAFTAAAEYVLAREPRDGLPVSDDGTIWLLPMAPIRGRSVSVFYRFDERTVTLLWIVAD